MLFQHNESGGKLHYKDLPCDNHRERSQAGGVSQAIASKTELVWNTFRCTGYLMGQAEEKNMKRLYKSQKSKIIAGVCGGIAEYLDVDPVLVRLIAVLFFFTGGATLIAYIVGMIIMPDQPLIGTSNAGADQTLGEKPIPDMNSGNRNRAGSLIIGVIMIVFGLHFLLRNIPFFHPYYWWFWDMGWKFFWPSALVLVGLYVILRGTRK